MQFVLTTPQISVEITCGIQPTGGVTVAMEVLHSSCNMYTHELPDVYPISPWASGIHIKQIPHAHTFYNYALHFTNWLNISYVGENPSLQCSSK